MLSRYYNLTLLSVLIRTLCLLVNLDSYNGAAPLNNSAFCIHKTVYESRNFPIDLPEYHIPWIWDAVYDPVTRKVELTTMNRVPCAFNKTRWHELADSFPDYIHQLSYGLESNILVPHVRMTQKQEFYLLHNQVTCEYFKDETFVRSMKSDVIEGFRPLTSLGTLQIYCPVPKFITWNYMRIVLPRNDVIFPNVFSYESALIPPCHLPKYNPTNKIYNMTVCTATGRGQRENLVEWIEYNLLQGVNHFFIYDTTTTNKNKLSIILQDYIVDGIVTVVPWHFENCVRNMACGRWNIQFFDTNSSRRQQFYASPKAIAQYSALASCYSRFKHKSRYIAHIDDDEFLTFSTERIKKNLNVDKNAKNLVEISDSLFKSNPSAVAIRFEPVLYWPCNNSIGIEKTDHNAIDYSNNPSPNRLARTPLPRLGVWGMWKRSSRKHESKLIMRTDKVGMYFVHFISLVLSSVAGKKFRQNEEPNTITMDTSQMALLHYKYPTYLAKNILEGHIPFKPGQMREVCLNLREYMLSHPNATHAQIPLDMAQQLKKNYIKRIRPQ